MPELLAPAGSIDALYAAVRSGADAVYMGMDRFNARRNASNFDDAAFCDAVRYCRQRGVAVHLTLNTLISDSEHTYSACFVKNNGTSCFVNIHTCANCFCTVFFCNFKCAFNSEFGGIHNMVIADVPYIRVHFVQNFNSFWVDGMKQLLNTVFGCVLLNGRNRSLNICDNVVSTVKKCENFF